ncbi:unnamed protein product [Allacma fusca]|uniref:DEP domain-containing protein n=1 Tax=Allacma fusca TaxID=39272 RepID=A0A8J2NZQ5_9HEXA|nr:unnamed protein product [Allacma fusca]
MIPVPVKYFKLTQHQKSQQKQYALEDVAFSPKDFPFLDAGDFIEIYNLEEDIPRLVLKVTKRSLRDDFAQKDFISVEQSIANIFQLKSFSDVIVRKVEPHLVELDSIELTFKDQYFGRSEMWRLKNSLVNTCVHLNKKLEFCSSTIRCQVYEMWSHGDKVASGIVTELTKIVFRSSTSMVYLFIQMSSEMWEFDIYGDLYFEKAVNGFLAELFAKWKKHGSNHEVTIVLFSRINYMATSLEQFPESMRDCLQTDYKGRFYEDFYRVAVQNERYEDWGNTLIYLRRLFVDYQNNILSMHRKENPGQRVPKAYISSAAQGNFLEVLNMSLNVFEKHYLDRSFDRTGQLSVVITPGVGVFEVDRELTNVTMQRIIDNGVGSDLVCVGEQPLHAVPLLKFHNKATSQSGEDYSMPHWINLSFYSTNKKVGYSSYVPRIKLPIASHENTTKNKKAWDWVTPTQYKIPRAKQNEENSWPNSIYDFDDYDTNIFRLPNSQSLHRRSLQRKKNRPCESDSTSNVFRRQNSEPEIHHNPDFTPIRNPSLTSIGSDRDRGALILPLASSASPAITIPAKQKMAQLEHFVSSSFGALNIETKPKIGGSHRENWFSDEMGIGTQKMLSPGNNSQGESPVDKRTVYSRQTKEIRRPCRALINPFDPSHAVIKLTSNRRRWTHIFPRGPSGALIQQHHFHSAHSNLEIVHEGVDTSENGSPTKSQISEIKSRSRNSMTRQSSDGNLGNRMLTLLWGATGEQGWTPALTTGVDWKSLTIPACLPITTDYFPDDKSLQIDYVLSEYSLLPDDVNADYAQQRAVYRTPLTTKQVFFEIVSQRLAQGFQLIVRPKEEKIEKTLLNSSIVKSNTVQDDTEEYLLSIGRIFHRITLTGSTIFVIRYRPRHPYPSIKILYKYRFLAPNNHNYEVSWAEFTTEKLENYNWNYLDHYICTRGDQDFALIETLKYWRFRMFLLPTFQGAAKKILETSDHCNVYTPLTDEEKAGLVDGFLKFIETCINRIRRPNNSAKKGGRNTNVSTTPNQVNTGFRERVGSNRLGERPRPRSGSKVEKWSGNRTEGSGNTSGRISPVDSSFNDVKSNSSGTESLLDAMSPNIGNESTEEVVQQIKLKANTSLRGIIEAMCSPNNGFTFIKSTDLPPWTFVSADATTWLLSHMEGIGSEQKAAEKFNEMLDEKLILHASRDTKHPFLNGFYLFFIVSNNADTKEGEFFRQQEDLNLFRNEWMEVEVEANCQHPQPLETIEAESGRKILTTANILSSSAMSNDSCVPSDLETQAASQRRIPAYKDVYVDVDIGKKSDRPEWGHVRYQSIYKPCEAFEMTIQWVQATGAIITELVQGWSRKAQQCNLQLVPIPSDPYALPYSSNSDSLRGPIFVPLNVECLMDNRSHLFEDFPEETWSKRMLVLQESIIFQFGFIPCPIDPQSHSGHNVTGSTAHNQLDHHHYVHSSGNMFVLIPGTSSSIQGIGIKSCSKSLYKSYDSPTTSSYEDYITRHVSGKNKDAFQEETRIGFLWSWNYMVSKRWKTSATPALGDETFLYKVLKDFQAFCNNDNNRIINVQRLTSYTITQDKSIPSGRVYKHDCITRR